MPFSNEKDESGTDKDVAADDESRAELESLIIRGLLGRNGGDDNGEGSVPDPATLTSPDNDSGDGVLDRKFFGGIKVLVASPVVDEDDRPRTPQRALKCDRNNDRVRERISLAFILVGFMVVDLVAVVPAVVIIIVIVLVVWPMHTHTQTERERERGTGMEIEQCLFFPPDLCRSPFVPFFASADWPQQRHHKMHHTMPPKTRQRGRKDNT